MLACRATTVLSPALKPIIILDAFNSLAHQDKEYFRSSREAAAGKPLEQVMVCHRRSIGLPCCAPEFALPFHNILQG